MALTIYYTAFHPAYFTRSCEKGPGNGRILTNVKSTLRIPFRTEKRGVPLEVVHNFRKDFPENCLSI